MQTSMKKDGHISGWVVYSLLKLRINCLNKLDAHILSINITTLYSLPVRRQIHNLR